jgi:hypothetical protein
MGAKSTAIRGWALPPCGLACDFCNQDATERELEAALCPVAPDTQASAEKPASPRPVRLRAIPVVDVPELLARQESVFGDVTGH